MDQAKSEAFAGKMTELLNHSMLGLMVSVGHQTGLFDTLAKLPPATSAQIAEAAKLNERYVREWLAAMTVGRIIEHDAARKTYSFPAEHAAFLTRAAGPNNLGSFAQYVAEMGKVELDIVRCFSEGGGVPYAKFTRFQHLMREESAQIYDATLVSTVLPLVEGLTERLQAGIEVLDLGCGAGHAVNLMARAFPKSHFLGRDFSEEGIGLGGEEATKWGLANARFESRDAAKVDDRERFDLITTFDAIHDQADPARVLHNIQVALKPGGTYLCVDIAAATNVADNMNHPLAPTLYSVSTFHCMTVSLALGGLGLGAMWGEEKCRQMLAEAGFADVTVKQVAGDIFNNYFICRKA